ncbi:MAG: aminodeoxychorismate synthase component I [Cyclobacteriaceae bacterium]
MTTAFILFDDARGGGAPGRLYEAPVAEIVAHDADKVAGALVALREAVASGKHAAGWISYDAGFALEEKLRPMGRRLGTTPLLWFGLFDGYREVDGAAIGDPAGAWIGTPKPRVEREEYLSAARRVKEHLFAGDFYQANLTFGCDVSLVGSPIDAYAQMRARSNAGWGGVVRHPGGWLLSLSPEQFFRLSGGEIEAKPMKGTAPRRADPAADRAEAEALAADPKQRAENLMIVDLLRNDLARAAETGSVKVPDLFVVESFPTLHQLVSRVTATLRDGVDAVGVLETLFPCGSITGAPKMAAMAALRTLEPEARGVYTGSMGWIDPNGDAAFNVLIRTLEIDENSRFARLGLGSGLVVDSVVEDEWAECLLKGKFVASDGIAFDLIETMRFDPEVGIAELDRHLDRLDASATRFDFPFNRHSARNELQAATFRRQLPAMLRLLLSPSGTMAIELKPIPDVPAQPVEVAVRPLPVSADDIRLSYKTTARAFMEVARLEGGKYETIFVTPEGYITEGSYSSIFVERDGKYLTPPVGRGLLPGLLRARLIEEGKAVEADLKVDDLGEGFLIGNMVRGLIRARLA